MFFRRRQSSKPVRQAGLQLSLERLEDRWVPTSLPPGNYGAGTAFPTITSNSEFDQTGTYNIVGNLTVNPGVTLTVKNGAAVVIKNDVTLTVASGGTLAVTNPTNPFLIEETNFGNSAPQGITVN